MTEPKWSQMRQEYEHGVTYAKLAEIYGTSQSTISRRARVEGWGRRGCAAGTARPGCLEQVTEQLMEVASRTLAQQEEPLSIKEMRDMAALIRELTALQTTEKEPQASPTVRVTLEGDVEKWST